MPRNISEFCLKDRGDQMQEYEILRKALEEVTDEYSDEYISAPYDEEHIFSDRFNKKMDKLVRRRSSSYYEFICTSGRRAACTAAAIVLIFSCSMSVRACREAVYRFVVNAFSDHDNVVVDKQEDIASPATIEQVYTIAALPEGFEETSHSETGSSVFTAYMNGEKFILFSQYTADSYNKDIDNEHSGFEETADKDGAKYLIHSDANDNSYTVIWNKDGYVFEIHSNINKEALLDLCRDTKKSDA